MKNFKCASQRAALTKMLLDGHEVSAMNAFSMLACTNAAREVNRSIINPETGFGAIVKKKRVDFTSTYGKRGFYFTYKLERSEENKIAIEKMKNYLAESDLKPKEKEPEVKQNIIRQDLFSI